MSQNDGVLARLQEAFGSASIPLDLVLRPEIKFKENPGLDSLALVRLILSVEEAFAIEIAPREATRLNGIGDLADLIERKRQPPAG
jgi:acyl carrier protein